jgi:hypothetical protein
MGGVGGGGDAEGRSQLMALQHHAYGKLLHGVSGALYLPPYLPGIPGDVHTLITI